MDKEQAVAIEEQWFKANLLHPDTNPLIAMSDEEVRKVVRERYQHFVLKPPAQK